MKDKSFLDSKIQDKLESTYKSIVGAIPVCGTFFGELCTTVIPNLRMERVCEFIKELYDKIEDLENYIKNNDNSINIIEDALKIASETRSEKVRSFIVDIVRYGLVKEVELETIDKFFYITEKITEEQIILLTYKYYIDKNVVEASTFKDKYSEIVQSGNYLYEKSKEEKSQITNNYLFNTSVLEGLGLLYKHFSPSTRFRLNLGSRDGNEDIKRLYEEIDNLEKKFSNPIHSITSLGIKFIEDIIISE